MPANAAARRYAEAVFDIGREQGTLDQWAKDLVFVRETLMEPSLFGIMATPNTPLTEKQQLLNRLFERRVGPLMRNLLDMLLLRGRIALAPQIEEAFDELYLASQGIAYADVTTAVPLSAAEERSVSEQLERIMGKKIRLRTTVDEDVLGGIVAQVGDQLIDGSVATQLRQLRSRIAAAV